MVSHLWLLLAAMLLVGCSPLVPPSEESHYFSREPIVVNEVRVTIVNETSGLKNFSDLGEQRWIWITLEASNVGTTPKQLYWMTAWANGSDGTSYGGFYNPDNGKGGFPSIVMSPRNNTAFRAYLIVSNNISLQNDSLSFADVEVVDPGATS